MIRNIKKLYAAAAGSILPAVSALLLQSCFTGIESTPKITANDVRRENIVDRRENSFLADVVPSPLSRWEKGKRFYVTDDKISIIFGLSSESQGLKGSYITYDSARDIVSITGEPVAEIRFIDLDGHSLNYRAEKSLEELSGQASVSVPFTIEQSIVDEVRSRLNGNRYYVMTSMWYDANDQSLNGRKFIPVTVEEVEPGNSVYPVKVKLRTDDGIGFLLFMTTGANPKAPRSFPSLFSFDDPHLRYPNITDENWQLIINGRVTRDMTRDECRLALGAPSNITRRNNNDYFFELWNYENGRYLVFQDGLLRDYR